MKVLPTYIEYTKILKDAKATVSKVGPESTVATLPEERRRAKGQSPGAVTDIASSVPAPGD